MTGFHIGVQEHEVLVGLEGAQPGDPLANAIRQNVIDNVAALKAATPILDAAVSQNKLKIVYAAGRHEDLAVPPGNRLEALKGDPRWVFADILKRLGS